MAKKRNIIVGQSGGPTAVINSSLAGVYKNAIERGFDGITFISQHQGYLVSEKPNKNIKYSIVFTDRNECATLLCF